MLILVKTNYVGLNKNIYTLYMHAGSLIDRRQYILDEENQFTYSIVLVETVNLFKYEIA